MSTLIKPHLPSGSEPSRDEDLTGVRALLSALPEPDPMPEHLIARINASLTAEQAKRSAGTLGAPVTPLLPTGHRRPSRFMLAMAGAAAAIALVAVVGTDLMMTGQPTTTSDSATVASADHAGEAKGAAPPKAADKAQVLAGHASTPSSVQIEHSGTRYTRGDFAAQARTLDRSTFSPTQPKPDDSFSVGAAGTTRGLAECLSAIGASRAQAVRADVAFYERQPAVVIVATTNGIPMAYAVGRQCSPMNAAVLRAATPLP